MTARSRLWVVAAALAGVLALMLAWIAWANLRGDRHDAGDAAAAPATREAVERGAYLARAGNCAGCHTARGGALYAGGRGIATPFGTVYASNLTPDAVHGIGAWSAGDFWRALHNGRSRDGRLLYPAFPYPNYTLVTRADADAIYAYLRTVPPAAQPNRAHELRFPYDRQAAVAVWRALFFRAGVFEPEADQSAAWNRGAYLVRGLGHCIACHAPRNLLGASGGAQELAGGLIPVQNWYAPSLSSPLEAGMAAWDVEAIAGLLKTGNSPHGAVVGPMAEVVFKSTQHLGDDDLRAIAVFLKALPQAAATAVEPAKSPDPQAVLRGAQIYDKHCADCHGAQGQGAPGAYAALAGNRKVLLHSPVNLIRIVADGGYAPATQGNPRPYGMPPFRHSLQPQEIADVLTYVRTAWGNRASEVTALEVARGM